MAFLIGFFLVTFVGLFAFTPRQSPIWWYCFRVWIAFDQFINAAVFLGNEDHTISGHAGRKRKAGSTFWTGLANVIDWVALHGFDDVNHCDNAIEEDEAGREYNFGRFGYLKLFFIIGFASFVVGVLLNAAWDGLVNRSFGLIG